MRLDPIIARTWLATLALLAICASVSLGDDVKRRQFDYQQQELDNGLKVLTLEDHSCPIVAVQLWYHVGSKDENPERQGFAHMFEHMMFRGTDRLSSEEHMELIRRVGGACNASTAFDQTIYVQTLPSNQLELALWLEAERMSFLKIDQKAFDTERKVVEEERRLGVNGPYGTAMEKGLAGIFQTHPYRWSPIGKIPHLRAASVQELRDFWMKHYIPNNAILVIVGDIKHQDAQKLAKKTFGWIPRGPEPARVTVREPLSQGGRSITIKEDNAPAPGAGLIYRTVPQGHPDSLALELLGLILGGGNSSRIYRDVVAEKKLAVFATCMTLQMEHEGILACGGAMAPFGANSEELLKRLEAQIQRVKTELVTDKELAKARTAKLKQMTNRTLTVESKAEALGQAALFGDPDQVNKDFEQIHKITAADIKRVAETYLTLDRQIKINVPRNLLGGLISRDSNKEEEAKITAAPEINPPPPGKPGLKRPDDFPLKPPVASLSTAAVLPKPALKTLSNGMRVLVLSNNEVPQINLNLVFRVGAWTEAKPGTASMAFTLISKGTAKHDEKSFAEELDARAIAFGGGATIDHSYVNASGLSEHFASALELMAEATRTPTFPADEVEATRKEILTDLTISRRQPQVIADLAIARALFGADHPYARDPVGEPDQVKTISVEDLKTWWKGHVRPEYATLIIAGDVTDAKAFELAEAAFGDWKPAEPAAPFAPIPAPRPITESTKILLVDNPGVQCQIRASCFGPTRQDPDYSVSQVVSSYFGGSFNSRLNATIRVKKGLTYGARGSFSARPTTGVLSVSTFSKTESTVEAVQTVVDEIQRLRQEPPGEQELNTAVSSMVGGFASALETPAEVAGQFLTTELERLPFDFVDQHLKKVAQISRKDCQEFVAKRVDPSKMVIVVVGNAGKLRPGLEKIAPVVVVKP